MSKPNKYSESLAEKIADLHAEGLSITEIAKRDDMPTRKAMLRWMAEQQPFADMMNAARRAYVDFLAEECLKLADDSEGDWKECRDRDGESFYKPDYDNVARAKLKIDTRMKLIAKWAPQQYGEKATLEHTGPGGGALQVESKSDNELARRILFLMESQRRTGRTIDGETVPSGRLTSG